MRVDRGVSVGAGAGTTAGAGVSTGVASGDDVCSYEGSYARGRGDDRALFFAGGNVGFIVGVYVDEVTVPSDSIIILKAV